MMEQSTVGFIGLGNLGTPIALNLLESGYSLQVFNRSPEKTIPFREKGAGVASSIKELAENCGIICSVVSNDEALYEITAGKDGLANRMRAGAIHISMSTVSPRLAMELADLHAAAKSGYLAAPVMGRPEAAVQKKLGICLAGDGASKSRVRTLLQDLGAASVYDFGADPAAANVVKLCVNFLLASSVEAMAEAFALAGSYGVNQEDFLALLGSGLFNCPAFKTYGRMILDRKFQPASFTVQLGLKDIGLVLEAAEGRPVSMEQALVIKKRLDQTVAKGRGDWDFSAFSMMAGESSV
jgi:3-hydroxyisobutyrate dehydrogenase-like beta-hydroxyacid dehydrogenase